MCTAVNIEGMSDEARKKNEKRAYHHGDLRNALIGAAATLAEAGGPAAVTVRAAAREVGVTPTAAYRHFAGHEELLLAAQQQAQRSLFAAMSEGLTADASPIERLRAAGSGYITFALAEPGLFRTAFCEPASRGALAGDEPAFALLSSLLDELVTTGYTDPADRPNAEAAAWSAVHGLAALLLDGAFSWIEREQVVDTVLGMVARGLATGQRAD